MILFYFSYEISVHNKIVYIFFWSFYYAIGGDLGESILSLTYSDPLPIYKFRGARFRIMIRVFVFIHRSKFISSLMRMSSLLPRRLFVHSNRGSVVAACQMSTVLTTLQNFGLRWGRNCLLPLLSKPYTKLPTHITA